MSLFEPPASRVPLDTAWLNKFGDDQSERFALSVHPASNWAGKGPHLLIALHRDDDRCPDQSAAVKRSEVQVLNDAIGAWLAATDGES